MYVNLKNETTKESKLVAWCKLHKGYLTVKQLKTKGCLQKQCFHLEKVGHSWWRKREKQKKEKKERKKRLLGTIDSSTSEIKENNLLQNSFDFMKNFEEKDIKYVYIINPSKLLEKELAEEKKSIYKRRANRAIKNFKDKFIALVNNLFVLKKIGITGELCNKKTILINLGVDDFDFMIINDFYYLFKKFEFIDTDTYNAFVLECKKALIEIQDFFEKYKTS